MIRALLAASIVLAGCHPQEEVTPPPPPLRPQADPKPPEKVEKDCEAPDPASDKKPLTFDERSIPEGQRLADLGTAQLQAAQGGQIDRATRESGITQAVESFLTALAADPYNVHATYELAAAYSLIGRKQCTINLLTRLLQMRPHASKHAEVEAHIDHLLGRKQALDPDFNDMRRDDRFRLLIAKMCEGTNDANCVYGAQKDNRER